MTSFPNRSMASIVSSWEGPSAYRNRSAKCVAPSVS